MILGILSDSHGHHARTARALELLTRLGAETFVHCGDIGTERVLDELAGRRCWFVWGNCDMPDAGLERYVERLGLPLPAAVPLALELHGRKIAVFHGHEPAFVRRAMLADRGQVEPFEQSLSGARYLLTGHTHRPHDFRIGSVRLINPGALHRARPYTVATLDLELDTVEHWVVADDPNPSAPSAPSDAPIRHYLPH